MKTNLLTQVKIFIESTSIIEEKINKFLKENPNISIFEIRQSESNTINTQDIPATSDFNITISIWYKILIP